MIHKILPFLLPGTGNNPPKKQVYEERAHASLAHHHRHHSSSSSLPEHPRRPQQHIKKNNLAAPCLASVLHGRSRCYPPRVPCFTRAHSECIQTATSGEAPAPVRSVGPFSSIMHPMHSRLRARGCPSVRPRPRRSLAALLPGLLATRSAS